MRIELGKTYNLNNGKTVTIDGMVDDDHPSIKKYGYGPFYSKDMGLFHIDGRFGGGNNAELNIVSEWVDGEVGTLAELGVKAGDVVEVMTNGNHEFIGEQLTIQSNGMAKRDEGGFFSPDFDDIYGRAYRIISRADTTDAAPKTWSEMTDAEKGALLLADHEGKVIEWIDVDCPTDVWKICPSDCLWDGDFGGNGFAYRIKPEPKRETVELWWRKVEDDDCSEGRFGTIDLVDGEPDCGSVKMEAV